jgi:hypothetical protein
MWKKLLYGASKQFADDASRIYAKEKKKKMIESKKQTMNGSYKKQIIAEYQQDFKKQKEVKEIDVRLEYLIATNKFCNDSLTILQAPFDCIQLISQLQGKDEEMRLKNLDILHMVDFSSNEYFTNLINNTVDPYLTLSKMMFGEWNGDSGITGKILSNPNPNSDALTQLLNGTMDLIYKIKNVIREVFEENKKPQIVRYSAYGETGEVDFGKYTIQDLV